MGKGLCKKGLKGTGESTSGGGRGASNATGMRLKVERQHVVGEGSMREGSEGCRKSTIGGGRVLLLR